MTDRSPRRVQSVAIACAIVDTLRSRDAATVSEIAAQVNRSPATVHTHLATLADEAYIVKTGDQYRLSPRFVTLGEHVRNSSPLYEVGIEEIDRLANETGEAINLNIEHDGLEVSLYQSFGDNAVGTEFHVKERERTQRFMHYSAAGKAILAHLPKERVEEILDQRRLPEQTANTITDQDELTSELERIRERGFARNDEEQVLGLRAVGAPIVDSNGDVLGAVSLSAPTRRLRGEEFESELPEAIENTAHIIELKLQTE